MERWNENLYSTENHCRFRSVSTAVTLRFTFQKSASLSDAEVAEDVVESFLA